VKERESLALLPRRLTRPPQVSIDLT